MRSLHSSTIVWSISFILILASCSSGDQTSTVTVASPIPVTTAVATSTHHHVVEASGKIESKKTAVMSTRMMGFVTSIRVKAGDAVRQGQLLATINNADVVAKAAQAQAMIGEAEAAQADARRDFERYEALYAQQSVSAKELENVKLHYTSMKAKTEAAQQMKNEAEAMLTYSNLVAPFSGIVTQTMVDEGSMANPGIPIMIIERAGTFQVTTSVTESDIAKIKEGATANVRIKSNGRVITGRVSEVSPSSRFTGGQYAIIVSLPEAENKELYSGMFVSVSFPTNEMVESERATLVPAQALLYRDQLVGLYTVSANQTAMLRWVRLGKVYGEQIEILSGLRAGESFILEAQGKLYHGAAVQVN